MIITFVCLLLLNSAQPALLYLVPATLTPVFIVSAIRGDLKAMWKGDYEVSLQGNFVLKRMVFDLIVKCVRYKFKSTAFSLFYYLHLQSLVLI
jgi:hypothetical protein